MTALSSNAGDEYEDDTLEALVARIKARGPGTVLARPSPEAIRQLVEQVATETPLTPEEEEEWNRLWAGVADEIHSRDLADDIAEGRGMPT